MNTQIYKNGVVSYSADLGTFEVTQTSVAKRRFDERGNFDATHRRRVLPQFPFA